MKIPPTLKPRDKIGIIATARKISEAELLPAIKKFNEWGLEVALGKNLYKSNNQYSGSDDERTADLQTMLNNPEIKAIICARGGYGTVRIIDEIDFTNLVKHPKWIIGYSDVTVLHSHIHQQFGIATLHATMPFNFPTDGYDNTAITTLKNILFGKNPEPIIIPSSPLNRSEKAKGILTGGNLSILYSLIGTKSDIDTKNKILFLEDLDEYLYHIDRMIMNLKRAGKLEHLAGLIIGGMTEMKDNAVPFGKTAEEIIAEAVAEYNYPVCFNFPAGHIKNNTALIFGENYELTVDDKVTLKTRNL